MSSNHHHHRRKSPTNPKKKVLSSQDSTDSLSMLLHYADTTTTVDKNNDDNNDNDIEVGVDASSLQVQLSTTTNLSWNDQLKLITGASLWTSAALPKNDGRFLQLCDGPHGVRKPIQELSLQDSFVATCFPTAAALACSWNLTLITTVGRALSKECQALNVNILLGPGLNTKRHACGGRNFEYWSEDVVVSGTCAAAMVAGIQYYDNDNNNNNNGKVVGACIKHLALNNQEAHRFVVNAVVDERTAREVYLRGFQITIQGNTNLNKTSRQKNDDDSNKNPPAAVMCAYNQWNGMYCSEHMELLTNILRNEWKYTEGVVVSDWGATNDRVQGIKAGLDLEMPGSHGVHDKRILQQINRDNDQALKQAITTSTKRVVQMIQKYSTTNTATNATNTNTNTNNENSDPTNTLEYKQLLHDNDQIAYQAAMESIVLLQNTNNQCLPLDPNKIKSVAVIGQFGHPDSPRYQGMGSSQVNPPHVRTVLEQLETNFSDTMTIKYAPGYDPDDDEYNGTTTTTTSLKNQTFVQQAVDLITNHDYNIDVVLLCIGLPEILESEGFDRPHMKLPTQHTVLVHELCKRHNNVIVLLSNGGAVELHDWVHLPQAILEGYLLGQAGGAAMVDLIFGVGTPCGKLTETFPLRQSDMPADLNFPGTRHSVEYREGLNVGYRYTNTSNNTQLQQKQQQQQRPVLYPFGYGLSYTTFEYSHLHVKIVQDTQDDIEVQVQCTITNTGTTHPGKEIVQLYIHDVHASVYRPYHELKAYCKTELLQPNNGHQVVTFTLTKDAFCFYDIGVKDWIVETGEFEIQIGSSSRDIRLQEIITLQADNTTASTLAQESYPPMEYYNNSDALEDVDDATFFQRFGDRKTEMMISCQAVVSKNTATATTENNIDNDDENDVHRNSLLKEVSETKLLGKLLLVITFLAATRELDRNKASYKRQRLMVKANVENLPLRVLVLFSKGNFTFEIMDFLIQVMNWKFGDAIRATGRKVKSFFRR